MLHIRGVVVNFVLIILGIRMNKKLLSIIVISIVFLGIGFYFTPHLAVHNLKKAAELKDAVKISSYIDFPVLKESLKANLNALMAKEVAKKSSSDGFEALGMAFAAAIMNPMIDALVTPESLAMMMEGEKPLAKNSNESTTKESPSNVEKTETSLSYENFNTFLVNIKSKNNTDEPVGFVFTRNGLIGWKLTALRLPNMNGAMSAAPESATNEAQSDTVTSSVGHDFSEKLDVKWEYEDINDKFDGMKQFVTSSIESSQSTKARLIFRKTEGNLEAYIITGDGYICAQDNELDAALIFDDEKPSNWHFGSSQSNDAIFFSDPNKFAERLATSKEVYIRVDDTCGNRTDLKIDAAGFSEAYAKVN